MKTKIISVFYPKVQFSSVQIERLASLGEIAFVDGVSSKCPKDTEVLVFDGSIPKAKDKLSQLLSSLPNIKYLVLGSSDYSFVDLSLCKEKDITVSHVPFYDTESVSEHIIALLLGCMRRIFVNDRSTYSRKYIPELGHNFKGSVLGIIGVDHIGEKIAELAKSLGAIVYIWDNKQVPVRIEGTRRQSLDTLLAESDMITFDLPDNEENKKFLDKEKIKKLKEGSVIVNLSGRELINESAMNEALKARKVSAYAFEADVFGKSPLKGNDFALMFKPFSTQTIETMEKNIEAMMRNLESIVIGLPFSKVCF